MKRKFFIAGMQPKYNHKINAFIQACDLGISGVYEPFSYYAIAEIGDNCTQAQLNGQPEAIKTAYEQAGAIDVIVEDLGFIDDAGHWIETP